MLKNSNDFNLTNNQQFLKNLNIEAIYFGDSYDKLKDLENRFHTNL